MNVREITFRNALFLVVLLLFVACAPGAAPPTAGESAPAESAPPAEGEAVPDASAEAKFLTEPELCKPDSPVLTGFVSIEPSEQRVYGVEETTFEAVYENEKQQRFIFFASSLDGATLEERLKMMLVCAEMIDAQTPAESEGEGQGLTEEELVFTQEFLTQNPANALIEVVVATAGNVNIENELEIHFFIDPTLENDGRDDFRACKAKSAKVKVSVSSGSVSASLYKTGSLWDSTTTATPGASSDWASHDNGATKITYDSIATGVSNSSYSIFGGWKKDTSGTGIESDVSGCG